MDVYCIVPKKILDAKAEPVATGTFPEAKQVLSLDTATQQILHRQDISDWQKAQDLSKVLERFMALRTDPDSKNRPLISFGDVKNPEKSLLDREIPPLQKDKILIPEIVLPGKIRLKTKLAKKPETIDRPSRKRTVQTDPDETLKSSLNPGKPTRQRKQTEFLIDQKGKGLRSMWLTV